MSAADPIPNPCPAHVYIHVPFCARRCSYCDFSIAVRRQVPVDRFVDAIQAEMVTRRIGPAGRPLASLYMGGGTPSKLGAALAGIPNLVSAAAALNSRQLGEVTVEANPEDINPAVVQAWRESGVNRVSLGAQSFDDRVLEWMHRSHNSAQISAAVDILNGEGISRVSADLIFALPESLARDWTADLEQALRLGVGHLSVYGLTVEPQTPLGRWTARGRVLGVPEERYEAEFLEADRRFTLAGFTHYEVSNYARPGEESVHNSAYWQGVSYLGLGPSAHGFDGASRRWNAREYARWLALVEGGIDPLEGGELLAEGEREAERVYLGLRTTAGLAARPAEFERARRWVDEGWAHTIEGRLVLTPAGWLRLDALAADLLALAGTDS